MLGVTPEGIPLRASCRGHLFEIGSTSEMTWNDEVHVMQTSMCLVCGDTLPALDADFFYREATDIDIKSCVAEVSAEADRLSGVANKLQAKLHRVVSHSPKNFDPEL